MTAPADPVEVVAALHQRAAAVEVHENLEPRTAPRAARPLVRERWEGGDVDG